MIILFSVDGYQVEVASMMTLLISSDIAYLYKIKYIERLKVMIRGIVKNKKKIIAMEGSTITTVNMLQSKSYV